MNKMEKELRRMFYESDIFYEAMFCGKMMIGKIDKDIRAKIEFTSTAVSKHYDALKVTILNISANNDAKNKSTTKGVACLDRGLWYRSI